MSSLAGTASDVPAASARAAAGTNPLRFAPFVAFMSSACMLLGWHWDISWHRSIGRDTALTPPHILVYIALIVAFTYDVVLVLSYTFGSQKAATAVSVFGFRAPSGAFVTLWGLALQGTAILFDLWWHSSYGLDLAVFSPPHYAIMIGNFPFYLGNLMLLARHAHERAGRGSLARAPVVAFVSLCVATQLVGLDPVYGAKAHHTVAIIMSVALGVPLSLAMVDAFTGSRWASPVVALLYGAFIVGTMQVFQLFPATPKFGPVFHPLDRFLPPAFPIPLVVPALAVALVFPRVAERFRGRPLGTLAYGAVFATTLVAAGMLQARLIASPLGANRFFGGALPASAFSEDFVPAAVIGLDARGLALTAVAALLAAGTGYAGHRAGLMLGGLRR